MDWNKINEYAQIGIDKVVFYLPRIFLALLIFYVGFKIVQKLVELVKKGLERTGFSETLTPFLASTVGVMLKGAVLFAIATVLGADLTGLFAILAAAAFAVGMALQGSLGNFASGILILTLKPFKVGDWIDVQDRFGRVVEIGIFSTNVLTPGNKILIIPNSMITDSVVTNFTEKGMIRLELDVTMPYEESFPKVREILFEALSEVDNILEEPKPEVGILNFDSHNVQLTVRPYVKPDDFWEVTFETHKAIKNAFNKYGVEVAYSEGVEIGKIGE